VTRTPEALSTTLADALADPDAVPLALTERQHLAYGLPGIALLHIERAVAGLAPWGRAHDWLAAATRQPVTSGPDSNPFYGAPALAHAVACAAEHQPGAYERAATKLDEQMVTDVRRRLSAAYRRLDAQRLPEFAEFDVIRGLTGYGSYLLHREHDGAALRDVLDYCVRLTKPVTEHGEELPGWWVPTAPTGRPGHRFPEGHANHGMSHGVAGVLALLALTARHGTIVDGQHHAMRTILRWLDRWQAREGEAWPYWVTRAELRADRLAPSAPRRPSWCYGTAGLARAQQLAALALDDVVRRVDAEKALVAALTDPAQLAATTDNGLCHGFAGLAHVAARAADDAHPSTGTQLREALPALLNAICPSATDPFDVTVTNEAGPGFLDGAAGIALAVLAPATATPPHTRWDACLLIA
jgi:hypothetical protein